MALCANCGKQIDSNAAFCSSCGAPIDGASQESNKQPSAVHANDDISNNRAMGILAYIGILVLVPIFAAKDSKFARFHANQGLVLAICEAAYGIVISILNAIFTAISWRLGLVMGTIFSIPWLAFVALAVIGIINASKGEMKKLPVIGEITILK